MVCTALNQPGHISSAAVNVANEYGTVEFWIENITEKTYLRATNTGKRRSLKLVTLVLHLHEQTSTLKAVLSCHAAPEILNLNCFDPKLLGPSKSYQFFTILKLL